MRNLQKKKWKWKEK